MQTKPRRIMHFEAFHGACPQRIDHVQVLTREVRPACEFYMAMGFRLSEYIVQDNSDELRAVFLQRKGNPHDIVFVNNAGPRLHHAAFTIPEVYHLMYICDLLGRNGFGAGVEWGPGRHFGPGYARFVYLRDPDGHRVELFTNHYQTIDMEDEPIRWQMSDLNTGRWGTSPPASWRQEGSAFAGAPRGHADTSTPAPAAATRADRKTSGCQQSAATKNDKTGREAMSWSFARAACAIRARAGLAASDRAARAENYPTRPITIVVSLGAGTGMDIAGAALCREARAGARPAGGGREQARRRRHAGRRSRSRSAARRPHAGGADQRRAWRSTSALQADQLQSGERLRADLPLREVAVRSWRSTRSLPVKTVPEFISLRQAGEPPTELRLRRAPAASSISRWSSPSSGSASRPRTCPTAPPVSRSPTWSPATWRLGFVEAGASIPAIKEGKLRALAVSSTTPLPLLPEVPPFSQAPAPRISSRCPGTCCSRRPRRRRRSSTGCTPR